MLEHKWLLSEQAGRDVGLEAAIESYLGSGAPAPESESAARGSPVALDIDWSGGWDTEPVGGDPVDA